MRPIPLLLATALIPVGLSAADNEANNHWIRVTAQAWMPSLSGDLAFQQGAGTATTTDPDELGLADTETVPMLDIDLKIPVPILPNIHIGYYDFSTSGSETLSRNIVFGGTTFIASTTVDSDISLTDLYAEMYWQPIDLDLVGFGLGLGVHSLSAEFKIEGGGSEEEFSGQGLVPVLAARLHVNPLNSLGFEFEGNGISVDSGGLDGTYLDLRGQVVWRPINWLGVVGGYRHIVIKADMEDGGDRAVLDLALAGLYFGALAQF